MERNSNFKIPKVMNLCPELELAFTFWAVLIMMSFEDLILIFYIWVPNTSIEGTMKKYIWFK